MAGGGGNESLPGLAVLPIIRRVAQARRLHVSSVRSGEIPLDASQARHARSVLRLTEGAEIEVFDDAGNVACGTLTGAGPHGAAVLVTSIHSAASVAEAGFTWTVASAVPKGERADWMVEKLSELGAAAFIPLVTARSVVHPEGRGKRDRWERLATESAKQSRRAGVMRIAELTRLEDAVASAAKGGAGCFLSIDADASLLDQLSNIPTGSVTLFVGPEGGWTPSEIELLVRSGLTPARLTRTILRVETAAVAAAAVVATRAAQ